MAQRGVNKVILVGNLGNDPEIRYTQAGAAITSVSVATSESWKDKQTGNPQERTEWHRVVFFGRLAEIAGEYLRKGAKVYVEGRLATRKWQDKDGHDRYTTEVKGDQMQMLDTRGEQGGGAPGQGAPGGAPPPQTAMGQANAAAAQKRPGGAPAGQGSDFASFDDDIPF